jgi:hypothetical protein
MNHIRSLIYTKTQFHKVKCLSFDMNWCIMHEFEIVTSAIIKISSVLFALQNYMTQIDPTQYSDANIVLRRIQEIYHYMKEGLREYGCKRPNFTTGTCLKKDDVLDCARLVCETWIQ